MVTSAKQEQMMLGRGYVPVRKVSDQSGIAATTVYRAIREGKLKELGGPGIKYVSLASVVEWLGVEKARAAGFVLPDEVGEQPAKAGP